MASVEQSGDCGGRERSGGPDGRAAPAALALASDPCALLALGGEHLGVLGVGIAPGEVSVDAPGDDQVARVVRVVEHELAQRTELALDRVWPRRVGRREAQLDGELLAPGTDLLATGCPRSRRSSCRRDAEPGSASRPPACWPPPSSPARCRRADRRPRCSSRGTGGHRRSRGSWPAAAGAFLSATSSFPRSGAGPEGRTRRRRRPGRRTGRARLRCGRAFRREADRSSPSRCWSAGRSRRCWPGSPEGVPCRPRPAAPSCRRGTSPACAGSSE